MYQGMGEPLYDADIRVRGGQQADPLRRLAAGKRVNATVDWANLIDHAKTIGRSEVRRRRACARMPLPPPDDLLDSAYNINALLMKLG